MAIVKNSVVKMEWEQNGWLARRYRNSMTSAFIFAATTYPSEIKKENITVFFTSETAFIFAADAHTENECLWKAKELKDWYKSGKADWTFPVNYEEYVPVIDTGNTWCNDDILKEYGIEGFKYDIEARLKDVMPYGEESYEPLY